jgi:hypothetical protein
LEIEHRQRAATVTPFDELADRAYGCSVHRELSHQTIRLTYEPTLKLWGRNALNAPPEASMYANRSTASDAIDSDTLNASSGISGQNESIIAAGYLRELLQYA